MRLELWIGLAIVVAAHIMLHLRSEWRYRIGAAWMMTGAYVLAGGFATECLVKYEQMQTRLGSLHAAEPAEQMAKKLQHDKPVWTFTTAEGHRIDVLKPMSNEGLLAWPVKTNF